jgi:hypothetical protein
MFRYVNSIFLVIPVTLLLSVLSVSGEGALASETSEFCDVEKIFSEKLTNGKPKDWNEWWNKTMASGVQTNLDFIISTKRANTVQIVSCYPPDSDGKKAEGSKQWLLQIRERQDRPRIAEKVNIGLWGCCGGRWWTNVKIEMYDINKDKNPDIKISGKFEDGSDGHWLKAEAELYYFMGHGKEPKIIRSQPGKCAPIVSYLDRLANVALLVTNGEFTCIDEWCSYPSLRTPKSKLIGKLSYGKAQNTVGIQHQWVPLDEGSKRAKDQDHSRNTFVTTRWLKWNASKRTLVESCK